MNSKTEGRLAILAAPLVLLSAMWDPRIAAVAAAIWLNRRAMFRHAGQVRDVLMPTDKSAVSQ